MSIKVATHIDFTAMTQIFAQAEGKGRSLLYEHEVYSLLRNLGSETPPRSLLLLAGTRPSDEELLALPGDRVVLKIVSPFIVHKSDVGGVRIIPKHPDKIRSTWRRMMYEVAENYADRIERRPAHAPAHYQGLTGDALVSAISQDIQGVLLVQFIPRTPPRLATNSLSACAPRANSAWSSPPVSAARTRSFWPTISARTAALSRLPRN